MTVSLHQLPLTDAALPAVARWLLANRPGPAPEDLADALVILPSSRACGQLGHALLAEAGGRAVLLPRAYTPARLADHLAEMLGLDRDDTPVAALRHLILAPALVGTDWLADRPEAAPGLAAELIALFDEVRLARRDAWILDGRDDESLRRAAGPGADEVLDSDLQRIREAWRHYRELIPRDEVDVQVEALATAAAAWPGEKPALVAAAHLARLDAVAVALLRGLAVQGVPVHWLTADADDPRSRLLLASYRDPGSGSHPLAGMRLLAEKVAEAVPAAPHFARDDLAGRLAELATAREQIGPAGLLRLLPCDDPEHESRVVAAAVCEALAGANPAPEVLVATPDRDLAARIGAQLRDAGVDVDDSRGRPLGSLPAGRLLREVLDTVQAGWPHGTLFEVLNHPYVRLAAGAADHAVRVQVLEAVQRSSGAVRRGRDALRALAERDDRREREHPRGWSLADFVDTAARALAPLDDLGSGTVAWTEAVAALRETWARLAPDRPLDGPPIAGRDHDDVGAVAGLFAALEHTAHRLAAAPLADIAAAIGALLADPSLEVRPHRQRHLPVRLVGLVEARLEQADHLILAGLSQSAFPGRLARPLFLSDGVRRRLDLAHWRARGGRDAELFLRLLHAAPRLALTWPSKQDGQPALPSPLVQRLELVAGGETRELGEPPLYRREAGDLAAVVAAETAFRAEPSPVPAPAVPLPSELSHTALQRYHECPYRYLLANALGLRRPDPVEAEFTAAVHGNLAHAMMQHWLAPGDAGSRALAAGDAAAARLALEESIAAARSDLGGDLPGTAVAQRTLLALAPELVLGELERHRRWTPAALEAQFAVSLGTVADWLDARGAKPSPVPEQLRSVVLSGRIDRVDCGREDPTRAVVIDYKTGKLPTATSVAQGRELQLHLYALAAAAGAVDGLDSPLTVDHGGYYGLHRERLGLPANPHLAGEDALAVGGRVILDTALYLLDPDTPFALVPEWEDEDTKGELPCRYCEFRGACRLEEREISPALAARVGRLLTRSEGDAW